MLIPIKYNYKNPIKKKGSAIFLHIAKKNYQSTHGCVAISKKDFLKILPLINKKYPDIEFHIIGEITKFDKLVLTNKKCSIWLIFDELRPHRCTGMKA